MGLAIDQQHQLIHFQHPTVGSVPTGSNLQLPSLVPYRAWYHRPRSHRFLGWKVTWKHVFLTLGLMIFHDFGVFWEPDVRISRLKHSINLWGCRCQNILIDSKVWSLRCSPWAKLNGCCYGSSSFWKRIVSWHNGRSWCIATCVTWWSWGAHSSGGHIWFHQHGTLEVDNSHLLPGL